jgi:predicted amidophosphoribosyltransferase
MTRQRRWQLSKIDKGLCCQCGKQKLFTTQLCRQCLETHTVNQRKRRGWQPWRPGGLGRPPLDRTTT